MSGSRASVFRSDRPRRIDRYIDFFGGAVPVLAGLSVRDSLRSRTSLSTSPLLPTPGSSSRTFPTRCSTVLFGENL